MPDVRGGFGEPLLRDTTLHDGPGERFRALGSARRGDEEEVGAGGQRGDGRLADGPAAKDPGRVEVVADERPAEPEPLARELHNLAAARGGIRRVDGVDDRGAEHDPPDPGGDDGLERLLDPVQRAVENGGRDGRVVGKDRVPG